MIGWRYGDDTEVISGRWELRGTDSAPPPNALSSPKNKSPAPSEEQGVVQGVLLEILV